MAEQQKEKIKSAQITFVAALSRAALVTRNSLRVRQSCRFK